MSRRCSRPATCAASGTTSRKRRTGGWRLTPTSRTIARSAADAGVGVGGLFHDEGPPSAGDSVQFQTQWWIERFRVLPAVSADGAGLAGTWPTRCGWTDRDDQLINCVEVVSASPTKAILMQRAPDARPPAITRRAGALESVSTMADAWRDRAAGADSAETWTPAAPDRVVHAERRGADPSPESAISAADPSIPRAKTLAR